MKKITRSILNQATHYNPNNEDPISIKGLTQYQNGILQLLLSTEGTTVRILRRDFMNLLDIPSDHSWETMEKYIIKPAQKKFKKVFDMYFEYGIEKKGKTVIVIKFYKKYKCGFNNLSEESSSQ